MHLYRSVDEDKIANEPSSGQSPLMQVQPSSEADRKNNKLLQVAINENCFVICDRQIYLLNERETLVKSPSADKNN